MHTLPHHSDTHISSGLHLRNALKTVLVRGCLTIILLMPLRSMSDPYPVAASKKGLQVQMVDDALALGIKHAALNCNLADLLDLSKTTNSIPHQWQGRAYSFHKGAITGLDQQIQPLASAGVLVSLIILVYESSQPELNKLLLHPGYDRTAPNHLGAFNTVTEDGRAAFQACLNFLATRYGSSKSPHGRVVNYIIGNEVNSHWFWSNMGRVSMERFADAYLTSVRAAHDAIKNPDPTARVFVSLEHHWNIHYPGGDEAQTFAGRPFLEYFAREARKGGDFPWHLAFHPYPENLFEPRTWLDKSATHEDNTPRITFRNLPLLIKFLAKPELHYAGQPRRVILSEQGFHAKPGTEGELLQAAAYAYAYKQAEALPGIDSFILHRHVDHSQEGGLNLGLWDRKSDSIATPERRRKIYEVFRSADTPAQKEAFNFALPLIGIKDWDQLNQTPPIQSDPKP